MEEFEDAFFSRIYIIIHFLQLDSNDRKRIWDGFINMSQLMNRTTDDELRSIAETYLLNGRQIKNAIKTSQLLAIPEPKEKILTSEIIHLVLKITLPDTQVGNGI
jgi:hypothetical protein